MPPASKKAIAKSASTDEQKSAAALAVRARIQASFTAPAVTTPGSGTSNSTMRNSPPVRSCSITLDYTVYQQGASAGTKTTNPLLTFTLTAGEYTHLKGLIDHLAGHGDIWYNKKSYENLVKVATPEVANKILVLLKEKCPISLVGGKPSLGNSED